jgi:hypothetical protein
MSKLETITIDTPSGSNTMQIGSTNTATINLGVSGDTINVPAGVTIANAGTATGFGESNTPSFYAYSSGNQVINSESYTLASCETELWDTDSAYDTSSYTFTVPSGKGGKYCFFFGGELAEFSNNSNYLINLLYKNGSALTSPQIARNIVQGGSGGQIDLQLNAIPLLLSAGDTVQYRVYQNRGQNRDLYAGFYFSGFRISS